MDRWPPIKRGEGDQISPGSALYLWAKCPDRCRHGTLSVGAAPVVDRLVLIRRIWNISSRSGSSREGAPPGAVDLDKFQPARQARPALSVSLIARLLWDKGVGEFAEAARIVRQAHPDVLFQLCVRWG